jgi:hypothetical protein
LAGSREAKFSKKKYSARRKIGVPSAYAGHFLHRLLAM